MQNEQYDLLEQQEQEEELIETEEPLSKDVYKKLKEEKRYQKYLQEQEEKLQKKKHRARFTRKDNENCYICDNCGEVYRANNGTLITKKTGEYAYCDACLKVLYPSYKRVTLFGTQQKADFMSNHSDTRYSKGFN